MVAQRLVGGWQTCFDESLRTDDQAVRVAWVNTDGTGKPEFITAEQEVAYGAKLSPERPADSVHGRSQDAQG